MDDSEDTVLLLYRLDTAKTDLEVLSHLLNRYGGEEAQVLLTALARVEKWAIAASKAPMRYQA
jgi:hypothetical protein